MVRHGSARRGGPPAAAPPRGASASLDSGGPSTTKAAPPGFRPGCHLVWFKGTDLRLHDHQPFAQAHLSPGAQNVVHLFVYDDVWFSPLPLTGLPKTGAIRARFLTEGVQDLRAQLRQRGHELLVRRGSSAEEIGKLVGRLGVRHVHAYSEVCSEEVRVQSRVEAQLRRAGAQLHLYHGFSLYHLDDLPFDPLKWYPKTYSGFRREVEGGCKVRDVGHEWGGKDVASGPLRPGLECDAGQVPTLQELKLPEHTPDPRAAAPWKGGERAALVWLEEYIWRRDLLRQYVGATNTMTATKCAIGRDSTSKLSPWLAHGNLSPRLLWREVGRYERQRVRNKSTYWIKHELIWRDFLRFGGLAWGDSLFKLHGIGGQMRGQIWSRDRARLDDWVAGRTGFPFVDCFMRELAATGYTTHCGRECVAWFVVRDLRLDWRLAAEYFEHVLIDYEPTANWGNWAYRIAPTMGDASDSVQTTEMLLWAQQHDPCARHVKLWLPELGPLPPEVALEPWRLLIRELSPLFTEEWSCSACTLANAAEQSHCAACNTPRDLEFRGFRYGADYPLPQYVGAKCVQAAGDAARAAQVDAQLAADSMAGLDLSDPQPELPLRAPSGRVRGFARTTTAHAVAAEAAGPAPAGPVLTPPPRCDLDANSTHRRLRQDNAPPTSRLDAALPSSKGEVAATAHAEATATRLATASRPKASKKKWKVGGLEHLR